MDQNSKRKKWVKFEMASQAKPGARMRPEPMTKRVGRYKSYVVKKREQRPYIGNMIIFEDGGTIKLSDAKAGGWLILE
jgi:hypothetical protein